jgi:hypothetical protein
MLARGGGRRREIACAPALPAPTATRVVDKLRLRPVGAGRTPWIGAAYSCTWPQRPGGHRAGADGSTQDQRGVSTHTRTSTARRALETLARRPSVQPAALPRSPVSRALPTALPDTRRGVRPAALGDTDARSASRRRQHRVGPPRPRGPRSVRASAMRGKSSRCRRPPRSAVVTPWAGGPAPSRVTADRGRLPTAR